MGDKMFGKLDLVQNAAFLSTAIYDYTDFEKITWDYESQNQRAYWRLKVLNNIAYFIFRGSVTKEDFLRDVFTVAWPFVTDRLGPVHPGAYLGLPEAWQEIKTKLTPTTQFIFSGHSLGSMEANIATGLAVIDGYNPIYQICFGCPRPAFKQLGILTKNIPEFGFRNISTDRQSWDHITTIPFDIWPEEFVHIGPMTDINVPPTMPDTWGPLFDWHHMVYYFQGVMGLTEEELISHEDNNMLLKQINLE